MSSFAEQTLRQVRGAFEPARDDSAAAAMSAYMRGQFPFLGIASPRRRLLLRDAFAGLGTPDEPDVVAAVLALWALPEREYQYAGAGLLIRHLPVCTADFLPVLRELVTTKSWWDTVDELASHVAGPLVVSHSVLVTEMDAWAVDPNLWVVRTAILHQLRYKSRTDVDRLFGYCLGQAGHPDFFIRKAIGWALREYSKTDAEAVRAFVARHESALSPLSKREALLWLNGGRGRRLAHEA